MISKFNLEKTSVRLFILCSLFFILLGCVFRLWHINQSEFVFYDEGFYLNHNRAVGELIKDHYPLDTLNLQKAFAAYAKTCLASGKSLWFMIIDARIFFGRVHEWFWARVLAAVFGILTLVLTYFFAARFFQSKWTAWLSVVLLAILPSHVFYSRIGLQEALSTFLVLLGFYFYIFPKKFSWRTFAAGIFFGLAFFSNYRLIMLPFLIGVAEAWLCVTEKRWFDLRKYVWCVVMFLVMVFGVGGTLFGGINTFIIFAWVFHQQQLAGQEFYALNFLSYPYYLIRLEHWSFAVVFFLSALLFAKKDLWRFLMPFVLVAVQMAVFSLPEEKGARYLCVVFPFLVMAVAYFIENLFHMFRSPRQRLALGGMIFVMTGLLTLKAYKIAEIRSDYRTSTEFLLTKSNDVKFLTAQKYVQDLYVQDREQVKELPKSFMGLMTQFSSGYEYLVIEPQAYLSIPAEGRRFALQLEGPYSYISRNVEPLKTYDHFNPVMLERFVLEHSSNLLDSTEFLRLAKTRGFGKLYVYDLKLCVPQMIKILMRIQVRPGEDDNG